MNIMPALSMNVVQSQTMGNIGTAILAKSLDTVEEMGDSLIKLIDSSAMERSVHPELGGNIDVLV